MKLVTGFLAGRSACGALLALLLATASAQADLVSHWVADDLDDGNVFGWINRVDPYNAAITAAGDPSAVPGVFNGHKVVNFDGDDRFTVDAGVGNPMANALDFSITTVFRSSAGGGDGNPDVWWSNRGLVSMELGGAVADWGLVLGPTGRVVAGIGGPDRGTASISTINLADGQPHIATYVRAGAQVQLYIDSHFHARRTGMATTPRLDQPFSIGSAETPGGNHFVGDMAEILITNDALAGGDVTALHQNLAATYGITIPPPPPPPPGPPSGLRAIWTADSILEDTGSQISTWNDSADASPIPAVRNSDPSFGTPTLIVASPAFNGHNALAFDKSEKDQLRVAGPTSPMGANESFTLSVVFRTTEAGNGGSFQWWANTGIVDAEQPGGTADWGLVIQEEGRVGAGIGNPDVTTYSGPGVNDGSPHVAIFRYNSLTGESILSIDGVETTSGGGPESIGRNLADMVFGAVATNEPEKHFTGEIADIRVYADFLGNAQAAALRNTLHSTYVVPEPSSIGLVLTAALGGLALIRRRRTA